MSSSQEEAPAPTLEEKVAKPKRVYDDNKARATLEHLFNRYGRVTELEDMKAAPSFIVCRFLDDSGRQEVWHKIGSATGKAAMYEHTENLASDGSILERF